MNPTEHKHMNRALIVALAGALSLGVGACGEKPSQDKFGQNSQRPGDSTADKERVGEASKMDRAADTAERKLENAGNAISENTREAGKAIEDAALTAKVKSALIAEPNLKALSINVDTTGGVVTLKGTADSQQNRSKAEQVASNVEGVRTVRNELLVVKG